MHVGFAAASTEQRAVPVRAGVQVIDVVLVRFRTADRTLPSGGRATALRTLHLLPSRSMCTYDV
jgi:hypothetical protein